MMQRPMTSRAMIVLLISIIANRCLGFVPKPAISAGLNPTFSFMPLPEAEEILFSDTVHTLAMAPDSNMEAEVLTDIAHVTMDLFGFASPSKLLLRYLSVVGRVFVIGADYVVDHSIHPEELAIQLFLMGIAVKEIVVDKPANSE